MIYVALRNDGLLSVMTDVPFEPDNLVERAIAGDGGIAANWQVITLTNEQYDQVRAASPARAYLNGGIITSKGLILSSNKTQITANGVDSATLTATASDPAYTGSVTFTVIAPNGDTVQETVSAVAGVATTTLTTNQVDEHRITAQTINFGSDDLAVEGI